MDKKMHANAEYLIEKYVSDFTESIINQSKLLAFIKRDDLVTSNHVRDAVNIIFKNYQENNRSRDLSIAIGGAMLGAFIQGLATELQAGRISTFALMYAFLGVIGLFLILRRS